MIARSALGCVDRTTRSSGSRTGFVSVRGPPKRANLARTREAVGMGLVGRSGAGAGAGAGTGAGTGAGAGVVPPGTPVTVSSLIASVYGPATDSIAWTVW